METFVTILQITGLKTSYIYIYIYILECPLHYPCRHRDVDKDAGMTILDIGMLSGYHPDLEDLNKVRHFWCFLKDSKTFDNIALTCLGSCSCPKDGPEPL